MLSNNWKPWVERRKGMQIRAKLAAEAELARCRLEDLEELKQEKLDNLLFLLMDLNSPIYPPLHDDLGEAIWILEHHRPWDYNVVSPDSILVSDSGVKSVRKAIEVRRKGRFSTSSIFWARKLVLAVFGRIHLETKLQHAIIQTKEALQIYMEAQTDNHIYVINAVAMIRNQEKNIRRIIHKNSLIGCYPPYLPGDEDENQDSKEEDVESTIYIVDDEEEGSSEEDDDGEVNVESPISDRSFESTTSEISDKDHEEVTDDDSEKPPKINYECDFGIALTTQFWYPSIFS
jgi:hypothetical protein